MNSRTNVVLIVADDLGFGDLAAFNPASAIVTPNLDSMASQGASFTDAHATSSVCSPSRYSMLTGRYNWRSGLKSGIVCMWDGPMIDEGQHTIASILGDAGYDTACIGKWHLGWDWPTRDGSHPNDTLPHGLANAETHQHRIDFGYENIDFSGRIAGGPTDRGFDSYFGVDVPNYPPYAWIEDDHLTEIPTVHKPDTFYGDGGMAVTDWSHEEMLARFAERACDYISRHGSEQADPKPFFLFLPLTAPHSPIAPGPQFAGRSGIGGYADLVQEVDWLVGEVRGALRRAGIADDTLIVFTSDNGPENEVADDEGAYLRAARTGHYSAGELRGIKRDAWEGGHRVPLIAEWPGVIPAGSRSAELMSLVDLLPTLIDVADVPLPPDLRPDGVSLLATFEGREGAVHDGIVTHSGTGKFGIRRGDWMYIDAMSGAENDEPAWLRHARGYTSDNRPGELYNLVDDPQQRTNRYREHPELVADLTAELHRLRTPH